MPSASAVATIMKRRERTIPMSCVAPPCVGFSFDRDGCVRRGVPATISLTRTRLALQEPQETCFHLIEEGCESMSWVLAQRGQAIVMMAGISPPKSW